MIEEITDKLIKSAKLNGVFNGVFRVYSNILIEEFEAEIRADERVKIAEEVKAMKGGDIKTVRIIYNTILDGK
jgi:hypothetical protein